MPTSSSVRNQREDKAADIKAIISSEKASREVQDSRWINMWALYKTQPLKLSSDDGWQSKLNDGRVFEIVETISSYIRNALFFSSNWVSLEATEPALADALPVVTAYFRNHLNQSNLKREFRIWLRQLLLLGFSCMKVDYLDNCLSFEAINSYDIYIESTRRFDEYSYVFRRVYLNYASFLELVDKGAIETDDAEDFWETYKTSYSSEESEWKSLNDIGDQYTTEYIEMYEYWCPTASTLYRLVAEEIVGEEELEKCPYLVGSIYELPDSAYGMSVIDSSIGLILENNCIMNRRLDNMAISVDNMWLFIDDGVTNPDDIKTAPGKVLNVGSADVLQPLYPPPNNFQVTYQETALIDSKIDKNTGTGALISSGQYRSGERVTAEEINAVKDAGGTRLTDLYEHIESSFVIKLLEVSLELLKKHSKRSVVKVASSQAGVYDYFELLPNDLDKDFDLVVEASQSVINRDRNTRRIQEFVSLVVSVPQFAQLVDYNNLYRDLLFKFGFDNPERYIVQQQEEEPAPSAPTSPMQQMAQEAGNMGGAIEQQALTQMATSGDLAGMSSALASGLPLQEQMSQLQEDPALASQVNLALNQPIA